jgi:hypothetical protein
MTHSDGKTRAPLVLQRLQGPEIHSMYPLHLLRRPLQRLRLTQIPGLAMLGTPARTLCHNIRVTISAWYELGIEPDQWMPKAKKALTDEPRDVLQFPTR